MEITFTGKAWIGREVSAQQVAERLFKSLADVGGSIEVEVSEEIQARTEVTGRYSSDDYFRDGMGRVRRRR